MSSSIFSRATKNIKRSGWRAYAVTFMMTTTFLMLGILLVVMFVTQSVVTYFVQQPEVIGFFNDEVGEEQILEVKQQLESFDYVHEVRYISREQAMQDFLADNLDDQDITEAVTVNVFPAHLNVKSTSLESIPMIVNYFNESELVNRVSDPRGFIEILNKIVVGIQITALSLFSIFTLSTIFIIFLTVGITIYSQKNELVVMKLVGATKWYVRAPYVIQSIIYSVVAVLVSGLILIPVLYVYYDSSMRFLLGDIIFPSLTLEIIGVGILIQIGFALLLSTIASYSATQRYINR